MRIDRAERQINRAIKKQHVGKRLTVKKFAEGFFTYLGLIIIAVVFAFPVLWLILASFSESGSMYTFKGFFPRRTARRRLGSGLPPSALTTIRAGSAPPC